MAPDVYAAEPRTTKEARLRAAIDDDAPEAARRWLDAGASIPVREPWHPTLLDLVVSADAADVLAMLIARGDVGEADLRSGWLSAAARNGSARVSRLLVERGADINDRDAADWTPLHDALVRPGDGEATRPLDTAMMLIDAGADVNAQTAAVGWTPLHLAADLGEPELARALLAAGARVNVRTHLWRWTPLQFAQWRKGGGGEVATVLRASGGVDSPVDDAQYLPVVTRGRIDHPREDVVSGKVTARAIHGLLYTRLHWSGGLKDVRGSFTAPDANERLVFERVGLSVLGDVMDVVALVDRNGATRLVLAVDHYTDFAGLCLDSATGTHSAVFERSFDGSCCPWSETVYLHYDAGADTLTEAFVDRDCGWDGGSGECGWREKMGEEWRYREVLATLRVGRRARFADDRANGDALVELPMRVVPTDTVESALATLDGLSDDVANITWNDLGGSPRWRTVTVSTGRNDDYTWGGVALLWDGDTEEWMSFYDDHDIRILGLDGDKLFASAVTWDCGSVRLGRRCYFELDLSTFEARRISRWSDRLDRWR